MANVETINVNDKVEGLLLPKHVGLFHKVSLDEWLNSGESEDTYDKIILPYRKTELSAGYDFIYNGSEDLILEPGEVSKVINTGIRVEIFSYDFLAILPRSGIGFKYQTRLANTVGVIDADYFYSDNEGHIKIKLVNGNEKLIIKPGMGFAQGIFIPFGLTLDDDNIEKRTRNGGLGSTD